MELLFGQFFLLATAEEVGPPGGIDEKRVPGEHTPRRVRMVLLREEIRKVLRRVAGRVPSCNENGSEQEVVSVCDLLMVETVSCAAFVTEEYFR